MYRTSVVNHAMMETIDAILLRAVSPVLLPCRACVQLAAMDLTRPRANFAPVESVLPPRIYVDVSPPDLRLRRG